VVRMLGRVVAGWGGSAWISVRDECRCCLPIG
jgi:hypothetical protein